MSHNTKEKRNVYSRAYRRLHSKELAVQRRLWVLTHPKEIQERRRRYYRKNKSRIQEKSRLWRLANPSKRPLYTRRENLKKRYGISLEIYETMLEEQCHQCAICLIHESQLERRLAVDHDHRTGKVRGLLCKDSTRSATRSTATPTSCNKGIGLLKDSPVLLSASAAYIQNFLST